MKFSTILAVTSIGAFAAASPLINSNIQTNALDFQLVSFKPIYLCGIVRKLIQHRREQS
jgi:hypothetical protein